MVAWDPILTVHNIRSSTLNQDTAIIPSQVMGAIHNNPATVNHITDNNKAINNKATHHKVTHHKATRHKATHHKGTLNKRGTVNLHNKDGTVHHLRNS